ncbi:MAG: DMT family transporter [Pseudomonadota bacterium]
MANDRTPSIPGGAISDTRQFHVHALMLVATGLVATSFPVVATITAGLDSMLLTFLRFALATLLFAPVVAWRFGLTWPSVRDFVRYAALSIFLVLFFWCMFASLRSTTPLNTAAIFALAPVMTSVVAAVLLRERLGGSARAALPIGAAGAIWVVFRGDLAGFLSLSLGEGDLLFLAGTLSLAIYSTLVKVLHRGEPMARMTFWTMATGTIWLFGLSLPSLSEVEWGTVEVQVFAGIAYLAVFTTIATFVIFQWSTTKIGPTRVVSYTFLNPALVLLIGIGFGDPLPPFCHMAGRSPRHRGYDRVARRFGRATSGISET